MGLEADLVAYYDAEARAGSRTSLDDMRVRLRERFRAQLVAERRHRLVDVGAGPGLDSTAWSRDGFDVVALDLARANVAIAASSGVRAVNGSLFALPFPDRTFDALWTMSTFVHVPHERVDEAMAEMLRVVRPGAPLAIGTWGGVDFEGVREFGSIRPYRFFSLATHERWRRVLARHGDIETFETIEAPGPSGWDYQFAVLRAPG